MTAAKKIRDQIETDGFTFGLWAECPEDVPVAWGARAIADRGLGFSLLPDRQTWAGPPELRKVFQKALNSVLSRANEECKRLREGWTPIRDLDEQKFEDYWRMMQRKRPELFESFDASSGDVMLEPPKMYPAVASPGDAQPRTVFDYCKRELKRLALFDEEWERREQAGEDHPVPDPPSCCENEYDEDEDYGEDCGQEFKKVRGQWEGCTLEFDAWVCDSCGHHHYVEELDEDDEFAPPKTPICDAFSKIIGRQEAKMFNDAAQTFTLYDDSRIVIKANTNASHGYVYLIAYPKHTPGIIEALPSNEHLGFSNNDDALANPEDVFWSGPTPIPQPGDRVRLTRPDLGPATVIAHFVECNFLFVTLVVDGELPEWWHSQNIGKHVPQSFTWGAAGVEIGLMKDG